jgi:hypothetical protein
MRGREHRESSAALRRRTPPSRRRHTYFGERVVLTLPICGRGRTGDGLAERTVRRDGLWDFVNEAASELLGGLP